jgi:hypothetical protein
MPGRRWSSPGAAWAGLVSSAGCGEYAEPGQQRVHVEAAPAFLSLAVGDAADVDALDADVPVGGRHAHKVAGVGAGGERHDRERWPELNAPRSLPGRLTADVRAAHLRLARRPGVGLVVWVLRGWQWQWRCWDGAGTPGRDEPAARARRAARSSTGLSLLTGHGTGTPLRRRTTVSRELIGYRAYSAAARRLRKLRRRAPAARVPRSACQVDGGRHSG